MYCSLGAEACGEKCLRQPYILLCPGFVLIEKTARKKILKTLLVFEVRVLQVVLLQ